MLSNEVPNATLCVSTVSDAIRLEIKRAQDDEWRSVCCHNNCMEFVICGPHVPDDFDHSGCWTLFHEDGIGAVYDVRVPGMPSFQELVAKRDQVPDWER